MKSKLIRIGQTSGPVAAYVDPGEIAAYAAACNDANGAYHGRCVPPTYIVAPTYECFMGLATLPPEAIAGNRGLVHGAHDLRIHKTIRPGAFLYSTAERYCAVVSRAGMNVYTRVVTVDDEGDRVAEQYWSCLCLGEVVGGDQGPAPPDHLFPEDARTRFAGRTTISTTVDQTFRYAGASGDRDPIHVNDDSARKAGFDRKFNQGLLTLAIAAAGLIELAAGGDPCAVRRIATRFTSPAFPGDDIHVSAYDIGETADGCHAFAFEADSAGSGVLRHGRLEVARAQ